MFRKICEPKRDDITKRQGGSCIMRSFLICAVNQTLKAVHWRRMKRVRHVSCIQGRAVHVAF